MTQLSKDLELVINDCQIMYDSIVGNSIFEMWDVNHADNWDGMIDILSEVKDRLDVLEEQNTKMWKNKV